jgi:hypothetical protein
MTEAEMVQTLESAKQESEPGANDGSLVFVSYRAGRTPTPKAHREAFRSMCLGLARRHCVGKLVRVWTTKKGQAVMTVFADTRDTEHYNGQMTEGGYRTFNPSLGQLYGLEVLK